jgi:hypothetical protein
LGGFKSLWRSTSEQEMIELFLEVLLICDAMELMGKEMFAV